MYIYVYITEPNIAKSEMVEYYIEDLGWFGLAWMDLDTWNKSHLRIWGIKDMRHTKHLEMSGLQT